MMDRASLLIIQHYLVDTINFNRDSLRVWYARTLTVSGYILLAKDFADEEDYTSAREVLDDLLTLFNPTAAIQNDIEEIDTIFGMLDARGIDGLVQADIDDLLDFSNNGGHAASISRSILMLKGYKFSTNYVLPDSEPEPFSWKPSGGQILFSEVTVYPNPNNGKQLQVSIPTQVNEATFSLWTVRGELISMIDLSEDRLVNDVLIDIPAGVYIYHIHLNSQIVKTDRLIVHP